MIKSDISPVRKHLHRHNVNSRYEFIKTLGKGTYGKVKLARHKETNNLVAVKVIRKDKVKDNSDMRHIRKEIEIMSSIKHQHIIQIYEVFENDDRIVIVMEYAPGGELYDYLATKSNITDDEAKFFFKQVVSAIRYCHHRGVVHRDIKLENILMDQNRHIKIADFGLANSFTPGACLETYCGSPLYASPEIVRGIPYKGPEVDSWSLGVLLYALVYGTMPFDGRNYQVLTKQITNGTFIKPPRQSGAHELICRLLTVDPRKRATINEVASHEWVGLPPEDIPPPLITPESSVIDINENLTNVRKQPPSETKITERISTPKSILKIRAGLDAKPHSEPCTPNLEETLAQKLAAVCGFGGKGRTLTSPGPNGKHRVLRGRRESGYYSSPERAHQLLRQTVSASDPVLCASSKHAAFQRPSATERCSWPSADHSPTLFSKATTPLYSRTSSVDGCGLEKQTEPASSRSGSSVLSSDSFDKCGYASSEASISPNYTPQRPMTLSFVPGNVSPVTQDSVRRRAPGSLTPKSEKLERELERILAPSGRRRRRQDA